MKEQKTPLWNLLSERTIAVILAFSAALAWAFNQLGLIAAIALAGLSTLLLIQLEVKHRMEELERRRETAQRKRASRRKGIRSLRASALNSLPSPILLVEDSNLISFANEAAVSLLGDAIVNDDIFLYLRQSSFVTALEDVLSGRITNNGAIRYTTSQDRSFNITIAPITGTKPDGSKRIQAMVYFYEVTSLLQTEQMRVDFVANASHELRTPLTTITGFIETLQGPAANDQEAQQHFLGIMQRESDRMKRLIDDLLSLSRIEMLRHVTPETVIDLSSIIKSTINACAPNAKDRGVVFEPSFDEKHSQIIGDGDQLTQVFLNLVGNAGKYADRDSTVFITTSAVSDQTGQLLVTIQDQGPGIAAEHLPRLTERFYRIDTARSRKMGGTGLGLAIVKHILLRHDTQLDIKSQIGVGTTFSFRLQIAAN